MKSLLKTKPGAGNLRLQEVDIPEPGNKEVRVKVSYAGICGTDLHIYVDEGYPTRPPVIIGHELSGTIDKNGKDANKYRIGEKVVSETYYHTCGTCGYCRTGHENLCPERLSIGSGVNGAFAEYVVVPEKNIHRIPENISLKEAALCEPLACCVQAVYGLANLLPEDFVIVTGPGTIGLLCLEIIKTIGCKCLVIGTEKDKDRLRLAEALGADFIFVDTDASLQQSIMELTGGYGADCAVECSGAGAAINLCVKSVRKGATIVQVGLTGKPVTVDTNSITLKELTFQGTFAQKWEWWDKALALMAGDRLKLDKLVTDVLPLDNWEEGFKRSLNNEGFKIMLKP